MNKKIIIAIDGYSACGKSTLARQLAAALSYTHIDSGALYRGITFYLIRHGIRPADETAWETALHRIHFEFKRSAAGCQELWMNGENVESRIREISVAEKVSEVAAIPEVRTFAVACQRNMGRRSGIVMDGRDIGTVVFPHAELKLFLTADFEVRVKRRWEEMKQKGLHVSYEEVKENLAHRDHTDTHREISPLRRAPDAVMLDNTHLTEAEQLHDVLELARARIALP